jgi:hypothetical protein
MMHLAYKHRWTTIGLTLLASLAIIAPTRAAFINLTPTTGVNSTSSVKLSDLISGSVEGVLVGDKRFSAFSYENLGDMPVSADVNVLGFKDADGNWGISLHGIFLDLPGGDPSNALVRYLVSIDPSAPPLTRISDAHLFLNGVGIGASNSAFTVDETFNPESGQSLHTIQSSFAGGTSKLSDATVFSPTLTSLHVSKSILAIAGGTDGQPARANAIDQSFSQVIPEPATALLSMIGGVAVAALRRKR